MEKVLLCLPGAVAQRGHAFPLGLPSPAPWQVPAESPPAARGHCSPPGALAWPGGRGSGERSPQRTRELSGLGRRRGRPLRELPEKHARDPGGQRPAGVPRGLGRTLRLLWRALGSRGLRSPARRSSPPHPARSLVPAARTAL